MSRKDKTAGAYRALDKDRKVFQMENDDHLENKEENSKLYELLNHPWHLLKEGGKLGIKGVRRFFTVLVLFALSNTLLFLYAISRLFSTEFGFEKILYTFLILFFGLAITAHAAYRTYQYVLIDTMRVIYENSSSFFRKISESIIEKTETLFQGKVDLTDNQLTKGLDFGKMVNSKYQKSPKFLRKGIILILKRIPVVGMLMELKEEILNGHNINASTRLYSKMDGFISDSIFNGNNTNWVWWLLPSNLLAFILIIHWKIG